MFRFRTVVNVLGDSLGAGIVDQLCKETLEENEHAEEPAEFIVEEVPAEVEEEEEVPKPKGKKFGKFTRWRLSLPGSY